ncbi:MAG: acetate--CoA ligase family protein, partial [Thermoprotei archaeon]|nr:acetate--CoA ligase family protein [Thermoprotei archaeon]
MQDILRSGRKFLLEPEAKSLCTYYGIDVPRFAIAKNLEEALRIANELGYPVVLKVVSPDIVHKSDVGGV